ncbi:Cu(+)/Ag(+) sensor histidine kinase [Eoetvoesiella caeni]|uniref:Sensor protein n=1 Tax=Eoetvoesiella caeni TaxID=645616 RepID=A0A366GY93_9BURK|nr:Cu(+)/Ag(+) sensor histidine kinase [Eoetvoesiella caeni]MCI2811353.1 Cu(+)/Ag(+) sensor histidine kinase [Eoetvoesiella caeni]NYT57252.1 Cu(+)/Ag(+) sensor histidine kinase [Eoetvoesiella caeni]RBP33570.1 two-component system heavy metal sensor histidine kinase CusS [Eoetvoesiella caeni]
MTRRPASLALRLTVSIGAVITVVLLTFGWIVERSINTHFAQQDVDELNAVVQSVAQSLSEQQPGETNEVLSRRLASAVSGHHNAQFRLSDFDGNVIYASPNSDLDSFTRLASMVKEIDVDSVGIWRDKEQTYRGAVVQLMQNNNVNMQPLTLAVAAGINFHLHYLESFRSYLRLITAVACLIAILATWLAVYRGHAPIRRISREIRRIKSDQLHIRLAPDTVPVELTELAVSFNDMLNRIEGVFRRLSNFSADIAHELRTPITNLKTQTEVALSQARSVDQYREILYSNLEEYERMAKMVGDMLFLAQADNKLLKPELVVVDLASEVRSLFEYFEAWAEERMVALVLLGPELGVQGDRLMIRRALSNLLSNAIRNTPKAGTVTVSVSSTPDKAVLRVENPASAILPQHLPHLFDRFYRPDASRQRSGEGAGLGLAIVKSIVEAHGGYINVSTSDNLITFEITLPTLMHPE